MGSFFKMLLAVIIGIFLTLFIISIIGFGVIGRQITKQSKVKVKPNSILKATFKSNIPERTIDNPFQNFNPASLSPPTKNLGLNDILDNIEKAKTDDNIKGIYLELSGAPSGFATLEAVRDALIDFKENSDKFIVAYGETISQKAYYLGSVADQIFVNPEGLVELKGFASQLTFFKKGLDRLGIVPQIFYAGNFKSATEPFRLTEMSPYNREQTRAFLQDFLDIYVERVAKSRNMSPSQLVSIMDSLKIRKAEDAKVHNIVDDTYFVDQVRSVLRDKAGLEEDDDLEFISMNAYANVPSKKELNFKNDKVAVVIAEGSITTGKGKDGSIGSDSYVKILRDVRKDDKVKSVVFRINSGGGSALASDIILREVQLLRESGKPVVVSMGDLAASGGYYIACDADKIYAEENTITGSIGVFGILADGSKFFDERLGMTFDEVKTTQFSDFPTFPLLSEPLNEEESKIIQTGVDDIYQTFLEKVADGREMVVANVDSIAQGRVWSGRQAVEIGLVDEIGSINDAIEEAAELAKLEEYRTSTYPKKEDPFQQFLKQMKGEASYQSVIEKELGADAYRLFKQAKEIKEMDGIQMRLPYHIEIH